VNSRKQGAQAKIAQNETRSDRRSLWSGLNMAQIMNAHDRQIIPINYSLTLDERIARLIDVYFDSHFLLGFC